MPGTGGGGLAPPPHVRRTWGAHRGTDKGTHGYWLCQESWGAALGGDAAQMCTRVWLWHRKLAGGFQRRSAVPTPQADWGCSVPYTECVPGVRSFKPFSPLLSTSVFVSFLFLELIELGACLSGALLPPARGCAGQEAKAARSGPAGTEEPPSPFGDPRASSYPQPSLRQGHSWAGSGQSARLGTSVLARVALKARGGGGGLRTNLSIPSRRLLSRPQAEAVEDTGLA